MRAQRHAGRMFATGRGLVVRAISQIAVRFSIGTAPYDAYELGVFWCCTPDYPTAHLTLR
jgi:hypothetical protein